MKSTIFDPEYNSDYTPPPISARVSAWFRDYFRKQFTKENWIKAVKHQYGLWRAGLATLANLVFSVVLAILVTGTVVAVTLTVYVMSFADSAADITLTAADLTYS
ncbi:MAG: hypothetical protein LBN42_01280, partial [Oscillospiraceae bacterium]|nr:hypothetical protein [Oscillospiraceae bacterium]